MKSRLILVACFLLLAASPLFAERDRCATRRIDEEDAVAIDKQMAKNAVPTKLTPPKYGAQHGKPKP